MIDSFLLYKNSSSDGKKPYFSRRDVIKDLNLDIIIKSMARTDSLIYEKSEKILLIPLKNPEEIIYRQKIIFDFEANGDLIKRLYDCAFRQYNELQKFKEKKKMNLMHSHSRVGEMIETLAYLDQGQEELINIKKIIGEYKARIFSAGLLSLYERLENEKLDNIWGVLKELKYFISGGELGYSFNLGGGMKIENIAMNFCRQAGQVKYKGNKGFFGKLIATTIKKNTLYIDNNAALKDDIGNLNEATMSLVVEIFSQYLDEMILFFEHFIEEIAFYMGVVNFDQRMKEIGLYLSSPVPKDIKEENTIEIKNLYEMSMAIYTQKLPVSNDFVTKDNKITIITGANQGGKSTFLRSYGIGLVLMMAGMQVPARKFSSPVYSGIFTHFSRRESEKMDSGRLLEELKRMSKMIDATQKGAIFLLNESFASTTEKEGAKIASGILQAFYEKNIHIMMVTHLYQLASQWYEKKMPGVEFLVAERNADGSRTFHMIEGQPSFTSYGTDLFKVLEED